MTARSFFLSEAVVPVPFPHKYPSLFALVRSISASAIFLPISLPPTTHFESTNQKTWQSHTGKPQQGTEKLRASEIPQLVVHRDRLGELQLSAAVRKKK
jgi:hypothetical protein